MTSEVKSAAERRRRWKSARYALDPYPDGGTAKGDNAILADAYLALAPPPEVEAARIIDNPDACGSVVKTSLRDVNDALATADNIQNLDVVSFLWIESCGLRFGNSSASARKRIGNRGRTPMKTKKVLNSTEEFSRTIISAKTPEIQPDEFTKTDFK